MDEKKKKQPSTIVVVLCILVLTIGGALFLSSGMINATAGAVTYVTPSEEFVVPVIVQGENESYIIDHDGISEGYEQVVGVTGYLYKMDSTFGNKDQYRLYEAGEQIYFVSEGTEPVALKVDSLDFSTATAAPNGKSFLISDGTDLYVFNISGDKLKNYIKVEEDVESFYYTVNNDFVLKKGTNLIYCSGGYKHTIETEALEYEVAWDTGAIYYIRQDMTLVRFQVGGTKDQTGTKELDSNVTDWAYAGNNTIYYIKDGNVYKAAGTEITDLELQGESFYRYEEIGEKQ